MLALTSAVTGRTHYAFAHDAWQQFIPTFNSQKAYLKSFLQHAADRPVCHLLAISVSALLGNQVRLAVHLTQAVEANTAELEIAEAMTLAMLPGGVPVLANAAENWRSLIESGELTASESFLLWAGQQRHQP